MSALRRLRCFLFGHDWFATREPARFVFEQRCARCREFRHGLRLRNQTAIRWLPGPHPYPTRTLHE